MTLVFIHSRVVVAVAELKRTAVLELNEVLRAVVAVHLRYDLEERAYDGALELRIGTTKDQQLDASILERLERRVDHNDVALSSALTCGATEEHLVLCRIHETLLLICQLNIPLHAAGSPPLEILTGSFRPFTVQNVTDVTTTKKISPPPIRQPT